jgi:nitrate/TMAO reductase-like tetraheme cytochrome c subunit
MNDSIQTLITKINEDYARWSKRSNITMVSADEILVQEGSKYIKIVRSGTQDMVWGFVVKTDTDNKFRKGDILKAAGWAAPARNKARGNILDGDFSWVRWTGPEYLK